tara:strand:+ start:252 stop:1022 length:771 start_codon:yes stop_codon:yes gene_type:complete
MKKSIQIIATAVGLLSGNAAFTQVDSVYIVKGDSVMAVYATTDYDSVIFYNPNTIDTTSSSSITDADGNVYTAVIIGTQEWMTENLRTTKYSDGTTIPNVKYDTQWSNLSTGAWCHYDNDSQYDNIYGKLYNWYAVETGKLCPTGWHVPTDAEWTILTDYLAANGHIGTEGTALKSISGWDYDGNGTDDYGWNGLPGGYRSLYGDFEDIGNSSIWWSSTQNLPDSAWFRELNSYYDIVYRFYPNKRAGFSVRCLRD